MDHEEIQKLHLGCLPGHWIFLRDLVATFYLLIFSLMLRLDSESSKRFVSLLSSRPMDR
jgi:hypothetical protein